MTINDNSVEFLHEVEMEAAQRILDAMLYLRFEYQQKVDKLFPPASVPGEYPRRRTGQGQDGCHVFPTTAEEIVTAGGCYIGFTHESWYMPYLERERNRLGLLYLYHELQANMKNMIDTPLYQRSETFR